MFHGLENIIIGGLTKDCYRKCRVRNKTASSEDFEFKRNTLRNNKKCFFQSTYINSWCYKIIIRNIRWMKLQNIVLKFFKN